MCSADDYFTDSTGKYIFDRDRLGAAHLQCKEKFIQALDSKIPNIFVNNTNILWSEMKEYVEYATIANYTIRLISPQTPWRHNAKECYKRNVHGVPLETIQKMLAKIHTNKYIAEMAQEQFGVQISIGEEI